MYLQEVEVLKEIPGYKALLKAVIKSQIQMLVEQLSDQTGEESVILTASTVDGSLCHLGSLSGKDFLDGRDEIKSQFLSHCLKKISRNGSSDITGSCAKKARYNEPEGQVHTDISYSEHDLSQQYVTPYPTQNQASKVLGDWESTSSLGHFETSTDRGGKMVVRKKRFKHVASSEVVPGVPHVQSGEASNKAESTGMKSESVDLYEGDGNVRDTVNDRIVSESDTASYIPRVSESEQSLAQQPVKVEVDDGDDDDDMAITGVEPGSSQSGYQSSEMDSSYDQSFQQGDSFVSPNASAGDLSYSKAAFVNPVPMAVMNTREQEAFMMSLNTLYGHHGNQNSENINNMMNADTSISSQDKPLHLGQSAAGAKTIPEGASDNVVQKGPAGLEFRRYPCLTCGKLFSQKSDVRRHQVVHTGQKFACSYCPKQFSQKHGRNLHEKAHKIEAAGILNNTFNNKQ